MENTQQGTADNAKTTAIVSYLTIIGWLIAYFGMYANNKSSLAAYHLRQSLLLNIVGFGAAIIMNLLFFMFLGLAGVYLWYIVELLLLVLWIIGLVSAINGTEKPIPVIGEKAQSMFKNL